MKPMTCKHCNFWREQQMSGMGSNIPGSGHWCSNAHSPKDWTRVAGHDGCSAFRRRGQKAPLWMIVANCALGAATAALSKLPPGRVVNPQQAQQVLRLVAELQRKSRRAIQKSRQRDRRAG
jgi:hypothetical protein